MRLESFSSSMEVFCSSHLKIQNKTQIPCMCVFSHYSLCFYNFVELIEGGQKEKAELMWYVLIPSAGLLEALLCFSASLEWSPFTLLKHSKQGRKKLQREENRLLIIKYKTRGERNSFRWCLKDKYILVAYVAWSWSTKILA